MIIKIFTALFLITSLQAQAQKNRPVKNIVFEGAGIRGIAYCGVVQALEENHLLDSVQRVGGTSAGAIVALTISLGYRKEEIEQLIINTSFKHLKDGRYFFMGGLYRLKKYYGWYQGKKFEKWISKIIEAKTGNPDITFSQLHENGFKDLYITGTDLTKQQLVVFSKEAYAQMAIKDAVRISMSIPFYFKAIFIDSVGHVITQHKKNEDLSILVDGGFIANFPIMIFDSTKYLDKNISNKFAINAETIGFRIDRDVQIKNDQQRKSLAAMKISNLKEYISAFYNLIIENLNRQRLTEDDWLRTISINDGNIGPRIKKLSKEEIQRLIKNGYQATNQFLKYGN